MIRRYALILFVCCLCGCGASDETITEDASNHAHGVEIDHLHGIQPLTSDLSVCELDASSQTIGLFEVSRMISRAEHTEDELGHVNTKVTTDVSFSAVTSYKGDIGDMTLNVSGGFYHSDVYDGLVTVTGDFDLRTGETYLLFFSNDRITSEGLFYFDRQERSFSHHNQTHIDISEALMKELIGNPDCEALHPKRDGTIHSSDPDEAKGDTGS